MSIVESLNFGSYYLNSICIREIINRYAKVCSEQNQDFWSNWLTKSCILLFSNTYLCDYLQNFVDCFLLRKMFRQEWVPGKGIGCFATQRIKAGSVILREFITANIFELSRIILTLSTSYPSFLILLSLLYLLINETHTESTELS